MLKPLTLTVAALLCGSASASLQTQPLDDLMTEFLRTNQVPGAALAVTHKGNLVYSRGFGFADHAKTKKVTPTSLFRIASISKPITSVAIFTLVDQGEIKLEDKLLDVLFPKQKHEYADVRMKEITLRHLLQHRAGWDRQRSFDPMFVLAKIAAEQQVAMPPSKLDIRNFMFKRSLDFDPGTETAYSNFGYMLLGLVIEKVSGQTYEDYVQYAVLTPIGISSMTLGRSTPPNRAVNEVEYFDDTRKSVAVVGENIGSSVPTPYGGFYLEAMDAHGGWIASAEDLARFACAVDLTGEYFLSTASTAAMVARPPDSQVQAKSPVYYGCGWSVRVVNDEGAKNIWHTGALPGTSTLLVSRHDDYTWAVLCNTRRNAKGQELSGRIDPLDHQAVNKVKKWPSPLVDGLKDRK
ncbi:MAG: beta-lactamase family protein [Planctomycetes bacterium]|nr:beta-lactamase family protein [Planctomycetota bacterium]